MASSLINSLNRRANGNWKHSLLSCVLNVEVNESGRMGHEKQKTEAFNVIVAETVVTDLVKQAYSTFVVTP